MATRSIMARDAARVAEGNRNTAVVMFSNLRLAITPAGTLPFAPHAPETSPVHAPPRSRMRPSEGTDRSPRRVRRADRSDRHLHARPERDLHAHLRAARLSRSARTAGEHDPFAGPRV